MCNHSSSAHLAIHVADLTTTDSDTTPPGIKRLLAIRLALGCARCSLAVALPVPQCYRWRIRSLP